jgi:hypothetical protein
MPTKRAGLLHETNARMLLAFAALAGCARTVPQPRYAPAAPRGPYETVIATPTTAPDRAQLYAVIVAVERYHGRAGNLPGGVHEAIALSGQIDAALPDEAHTVLLLENGATRDRLVRAIRAIAIRMRAPDTLMLVIDTHGSGNELMLDDGELERPQLARLIDAVPGNVVLVLNSCGAGAYASLVAGRDNRSGIFSSSGDEVTYGDRMLHILGDAFAHRIGRTDDGGLSLSAITEYVRRSALLQHESTLHWTALGVVPRHWTTQLATAARPLGGRLDAHEALATDCRDKDGCVTVDDALDHVLDPLDDTAEQAGRN